jgi:hypothetical protein
MNTVTSGGAYTTLYATPDQSKASCWSNGPNNNVWFKFTAVTAGVTAGVKVSGAGETMQNPFLAIYDASMNPLACQNFMGSKTDLSLTYTSLTPGNTYYIVVDNYVGYAGSFDLAVFNDMVILPLQLISFNASMSQKQVKIDWVTAKQENIGSFTIQRSNSMSDFWDIGQVSPTGGGAMETNYTFQDSDPVVGDAYYRLKIADKNGGFTYSKVVGVNNASGGPISFTLFPNPNSGKEMIWLKVENSRNTAAVVVNLYDMLGRNFYSRMENFSGSSTYLLRIPISQQLNAGIYSVTVTDARSGETVYRQQLLIK